MLAKTQELGDRALEGQSCFCLGNTYTLLRDFPTAIEYHMKHLRIAQVSQTQVATNFVKMELS